MILRIGGAWFEDASCFAVGEGMRQSNSLETTFVFLALVWRGGGGD